jgi:hypothetical protein
MPSVRQLTAVLQEGRSFSRHVYEKCGPPIEPGNITGGRRPHNSSVVWSLTALIVLGGTVEIAAAIATRWTRFTVGAVGLVLSLGLIAGAVYDIWVQNPSKPSPTQRPCKRPTDKLLAGHQRPYNRNLGNTILTAIIATAVMTALYVWQWYPSLNQIVLQLSDDMVVRFHS